MYNIDVNFLRDRKLDGLSTGTSFAKKAPTPMAEKLPIFIGAGVGVACIAAAGGALLLVNSQKTSTENEIATLETEITRLQGQSQQIQDYENKIKTIKDETESFVSVFKSIKPWSAMLKEISSLIPAKVQIASITQSETVDSTTQSKRQVLNIKGIAQSYDDVGDFVLNLKRSQFINPENTKLTSSEFTKNPNELKNSGADLKNSMVVLYDITAEISDVPAPELINALDSRGAIGLVARLKILKEKGAIETKGVVKP